MESRLRNLRIEERDGVGDMDLLEKAELERLRAENRSLKKHLLPRSADYDYAAINEDMAVELQKAKVQLNETLRALRELEEKRSTHAQTRSPQPQPHRHSHQGLDATNGGSNTSEGQELETISPTNSSIQLSAQRPIRAQFCLKDCVVADNLAFRRAAATGAHIEVRKQRSYDQSQPSETGTGAGAESDVATPNVS